jgi:hypothetical protein
MAEVQRMTFGSTFIRRCVAAGAADFVWIRPKTGRWLVETLKGGGSSHLWDVAGLYVVTAETFMPEMLDAAWKSPSEPPAIFRDNRIAGSFGAGVLEQGIPLEADEIVIGREQTLVVSMMNISGGALLTPALAAICQRVER